MQIVVFVGLITALAFLTEPFARAEGGFSRTLAVSGPVELDVSTDAGGITISPGPVASVQVHAILRARVGWLPSEGSEEKIREIEKNPPVEQTGNRIRIGYIRDRNLLRGISMRLEIRTPANTRLLARADSGGIEVDGIRGPAKCETDSGGIEIRHVGSDVHARADSGGIHIRDVNGSVEAHADSGGVEAYDIGGGIDVHTDSGGIRISQTKAGPIHAEADSGGVRAILVPTAGYDVDIETGSGRVTVPDMTARSGFSRHHVAGKIRGGGAAIVVRVDSGAVSIN